MKGGGSDASHEGGRLDSGREEAGLAAYAAGTTSRDELEVMIWLLPSLVPSVSSSSSASATSSTPVSTIVAPPPA